MFDTIKQVVNDAIEGTAAAPYARQYASVIDKVAADVATHISKCGEDAIEAAVEKYDVPEDEARALLVDAGLAVEREPEVAVANDTTVVNVEVDRRLTAIEQTLTRLNALAERAERSGYLR